MLAHCLRLPAGLLLFLGLIASQGNSQSVGSTDSSSAQNTMSQAELVSPVSMRTDSGQQQQDQQEALMVTIDDYNYSQGLGAAPATAPSFQQHAGAQDKVRNSVNVDICNTLSSSSWLFTFLDKFFVKRFNASSSGLLSEA